MILDLDDLETERIAARLCACGCGEALPTDNPDRRVASSACRKRLHRQRIKAGRAIPLDARRRARKIADLEARIAAAERERDRHRAAAAHFERDAAGLRKALEAARALPLFPA